MPLTPATGRRPQQRSIGNAAVARMIQQERHVPILLRPPGHRHGYGVRGRTRTAFQRARRAALPGATTGRTGAHGDGDAPGRDIRLRRIDDGASAARSASEIGARAYTSGDHVVLGRGGTDKHTLAHELTHVIQQRQGPVAGTDTGSGLRVSDPRTASSARPRRTPRRP
ncbi:hypothetical protein SMICM304S_02207 [Streptomyces microflavus]